MATLQNIRSKGPLLVIVIGLALFAFIAGDAWKVLQPHQSQDVGEVNGESISAQDYQALVEEYTEVIKFSSGNSALNDEQTNQIKDEVWRTYINNKLIEREAKKSSEVLEQEFCILLTIRDPSGKAPVYNEVTQQLQEKNFVYSDVRIKNDVREHIRIEGDSNG